MFFCVFVLMVMLVLLLPPLLLLLHSERLLNCLDSRIEVETGLLQSSVGNFTINTKWHT